MFPLKLSAPLKDYIWGGSKLKEEYGKQTEGQIVAESWEVSCHKNGASVVDDGSLNGKTLSEVIAENPDVLGTNCEGLSDFPILIKLIDAQQNLSVQVHPDDAYAAEHEGGSQGKTEMWYIVQAKPDAFLYCGFQRDISREELREQIEHNTLEEVLQKIPVQAGDVIFIPAGTVHAICGGILIAEIQQNSDTTYRLYDYGRLGADGKPRELHIEKGVVVSDLHAVSSTLPPVEWTDKGGYRQATLSTCRYFDVQSLRIDTTAALHIAQESFAALTMVTGCADIRCGDSVYPIKKGDSYFLPAGLGEIVIQGIGEILVTQMPSR